MNRHNPYGPPFWLWSEETRHAHAAMPLSSDGHIVNPRYLPSLNERKAMTVRWREWSRRFPPRLHPLWLEGWFAEASANGLTP